MRSLVLPLSILAVCCMTSFVDPPKTLTIKSAFTNNSPIPIKYTCKGQSASPPITITNYPANTVSFVVIVYDPEGQAVAPAPAPAQPTAKTKKTKTTAKKKPVKKVPAAATALVPCNPDSRCFINWMMWNLEVSASNLPENYKSENEGQNSLGEYGYHGMCPKSGTHYYHIKVFALDTKLNISKKSSKSELEKVMQGHILATGELIGTFNKDYK